MQVLPPANGKKMWRVKRSVSSGSAGESDSSLECLNNSLKMSAAGKDGMTKRSPIKKRPRSKPGMPKDFVFVDLSPIKSDDAENDVSSVASPNMEFSPNSQQSQSPMSNESFVYSSEDELACSLNYDLFDQSFGLGLVNNYNYGPLDTGVFHTSFQPQPTPVEAQPQTVDAVTAAPAHNPHKRSRSASIPRRKSAGGFQFKSYNGPAGVRKPADRPLRRTQSQPTQQIVASVSQMEANMHTPPLQCTTTPTFPPVNEPVFQSPTFPVQVPQCSFSEFDAFMHMPKEEIVAPAHGDMDSLESLLQPINLDFFPKKDDFDFSSFIAI